MSIIVLTDGTDDGETLDLIISGRQSVNNLTFYKKPNLPMKLNSLYSTTRSGNNNGGGGGSNSNTSYSPRGCCVAPDIPEKKNCSICFQVLTVNNKYITVTCKHLFCIQCIYQWIKEKSTCPYCRSIIKNI